MKITFEGIKSTITALEKAVESEISSLGDFTLNTAKKYTAIRSGNARRNWQLDKEKGGFTVENTVPYIERLDNGWSKQQPRGITKPTLRDIQRRKRK